METATKAAFILICEGRISVLKRRSKTPFTGYCLCLPREEDDFVSMHCACVHYVDRRRHVKWGARFLGILNSGYCLFMHVSTARDLELKWNRKRRFIWTSFKTWLYVIFAFMLPPESAFFALTTIVLDAPFFGAFLNRRFWKRRFIRKISMGRNGVFALTTFEKRWFLGLKKFKHKTHPKKIHNFESFSPFP